MVSFNSSVTSLPANGYFTPTPGVTPPAPAPGPTPPLDRPVYQPQKGLNPLAPMDIANMIAHPIQTVKSFYTVTKDLLALNTKRNLSAASAEPAIGQYKAARANLDAAPFKNIIPFFGRALDRWADARFYELKPQVEAKVSERAWHPIALEWPDGGSGHDRLMELEMLNRLATTASDGQIVRAFQGANRLRITNSNAVDYFYPLAREGDALILRRNLPLVPGQKPLEETMTGLFNQSVQVHVQI